MKSALGLEMSQEYISKGEVMVGKLRTFRVGSAVKITFSHLRGAKKKIHKKTREDDFKNMPFVKCREKRNKRDAYTNICRLLFTCNSWESILDSIRKIFFSARQR